MKKGSRVMIEYIDKVEGIERDMDFEEDYSEIAEDYDDDDVEMRFPDEFDMINE